MFWRLKYAADSKLQCCSSVEPKTILEECFKNVSLNVAVLHLILTEVQPWSSGSFSKRAHM